MIRNSAQEVLTSYGGVIKSELEKALENAEDPEIYQRLQFIIKTIPLVWDEPGDEPELTEFIHDYRRANALSKMVAMEGLRRLPMNIQIKVLDRIFRKEQNSGSALFAAMAFWYWRPEADSPQYVQITRFVNDSWQDSKILALKNLYYLVNYKQVRAEATIWFDNQLQNMSDLNRSSSKSMEQIPEYIGAVLVEFARREAESLLTDEELGSEKRIKFTDPRFGYSSITIVNGAVQPQLNLRSQILVALSNSNSSDAQNLATASAIPLLGPIYLFHRGLSKDAETWLKWELSEVKNATVLLNRSIAEMLHDYNLDKAAADFLESTTTDDNSTNKQIRILSTEDKGRYEYFRACQAKQENKPDKQWEFLQEALKADKEELDSLIMQWELCQLPAEENKIAAITDEVRKQVDESIEKLLSELNEEIINSGSDSSTMLNKYAWLAVKTNRHLDNALKYSQEAVENNPLSSACTDTLAHCYAANGDLDKAIEFQLKAVKQEPTSQVLYNNLLHFKELKEKEKE